MRGKAQRVARPEQMRPQNFRVTGPKFTQNLPDAEGSLAVTTADSQKISYHRNVP